MSTHTVLYRKYRSNDFGELIGQQHITQALQGALDAKRIAHAYLFTGPRGTGKTSAARILARKVNNIEDSQGDNVDIIEIDAASNNGVDEIRELREKVHIAPNYHDYKVYIIDEVHMLSGAAFNALLKTLEEPPSHVIFVLATTEPHKLPQTIISRTQHFPFRLVPLEELKQHLKAIAKSESINIEEDAIELVAKLGEGSVRDSLSILDQLQDHDGGAIDPSGVRSMIGMPHHEEIINLHQAIINHKPQQMLEHYDNLLDSGTSPRHLLRQLTDVAREYVRDNIGSDTADAYFGRNLLNILTTVPSNTLDPEVTLEAALLKACYSTDSNTSTKPKHKFKDRIEPSSTKEKAPKKKKEAKVDKPKKEAKPESSISPEDTDTLWLETLSRIKSQNASLYGLLRNASVEIEDSECILTSNFQFHYRRLQDKSTQETLLNVLDELTGQKMRLKIEISKPDHSHEPKPADEPDTSTKSTPKANADDAKSQVLDILGGEVVHG